MSRAVRTVFDLFAHNLPEHAAKTFLVDPDRSWTYAEVAAEVGRVCAFLAASDLQPGDRVVVQVRKGMREVAAMLAVSRIGCVFVNVNTVWTGEQLHYVIEDSGARGAILEGGAAAALPGGHALAVLVAGGAPAAGMQLWDDLPAAEPEVPISRDDGDLAAIIYTSGSTGRPKGVMLTHANIVSGARSVTAYLELRGDDRLLSVLPYSFDYGFNQLTTMMLVGGTVVHQPVAMATEIVRVIREQRVTGFAAVPPLWIQFIRLLDASGEVLPSLRLVTNSGGKIPLNILERMPALLPDTRIYLMYGLTEAFRSTYLPPEKFAAKMGAIGRAVPENEVYVIREGIGIAGPGEQGELVHRGAFVSQGYWNRPDATAEKIRPCPELAALIGEEPVVYSGDIVRIDEDGDLWFVSRRDALIKSSGFRISPDEVEDIVHRSGMAADVVVFGVADDLLGQSVQVAATLAPGATREGLLAYCRKVMPAYMVPRAIHVWNAPMPRTASGKLARPEVVRLSTPGAERPQLSI
ncbi:AMP-binding protein [Novosphingobium resinovorum]|uniref:AMP-dependent synthetase/ligase n=1 Tax=Novosphingobium resinovorum TaxID=158500 RepID=A0A031K3R2_9SPHN|nr:MULTISPECIES: AMP-binding protein [Sphingomonadaceae]EJU12924.1 AMP-dependent synthetase/ligase [Sphingomonas sp. LH128]EZP83860.1 AMP-dependent synthetase/ligase [Novosphingobium resinovorum]MBF7011977.1 AMP-binding protein [Novosphingobium sp. HR1a]WJM26727.1 AMP-binding protein [Novosphingobium resinovorum]